MNKVTKFAFLLLFFLPLNSYLQDYEKSNKHILLRGKVSSFFLIEDNFWRNANIGAEFRLLNRHSIGIDYVFFRWRYQQDSIVDGIEYSTGFNAFSRRDYINLDYRFYPFKNLIDKKGIDPYLNTFVKIGKRKIWSEDPSARVVEEDFRSIIKQNSNYNDFGLAIGLRLVDDLFGFDINMGVVKRTSHIWYEQGYSYSTNGIYESFNTIESKWTFHIRLNLFIRILQY